MTEQNIEKQARELVESFRSKINSNCEHECYCTKEDCKTEDGVAFCYVDKATAKQCAIKCCDEVINELEEWGAPYLFEDSQLNDWAEKRLYFLKSVKQFITDKI